MTFRSTFNDTLDPLIVGVLGDDTVTVDGTSVSGVWRESFVEVNGVETTAPTFTSLTSSFPAMSHGSAVVYDSANYTIVGIEPNETGMTMIVLQS